MKEGYHLPIDAFPAISKSPEQFRSPHDLLGKEFKYNEIQFRILGVDSKFYDEVGEQAKDLEKDAVVIIAINSKKAAVIPLEERIAIITKICIYGEEIDGPEVIAKRIHMIANLPRVDSETGIYTDTNDKRWMTSNSISKRLDITNARIHSLSLSSIKGRDIINRETDLYDLDEAEEKLKDFFALPMVDSETGIYTDPSGKRWMTERPLAEKFKVSSQKIHSLSLSSIKGRNMGNARDLYSIDEAEERIKDFLALPMVDSETGIYTDPNGKRWMAKKPLAEKFKVSSQKIHSLSFSSIKGRDKNNVERDLYSIDEAEEKLKDFLALPRVDSETGM